MFEVPDDLKMDRLERGRVYELQARNFSTGVWNGEGFIGIRTKFDNRYLFTEYHCGRGAPYGTVYPIRATDAVVPDGIELVERFSVRCAQCEGSVEFIPDTPGTRIPGHWHHVDQALDAGHDPHGQAYMPDNEALFEFLEGLE